MKNFIQIRILLFVSALFALGLPVLSAQSSAGDGDWPREIDTGDVHLVIYQPQVDRWEGNRIEARVAVIATRKDDSNEVFGTLSFQARTDVDRETRIVTFEDIVLKQADFPSDPSLQPVLLSAIRQQLAAWPKTVSLDRLLADVSMTQAQAKTDGVHLKNDAPKILFSRRPAVLILIDGEPVYRAVPGTTYQKVANTPALMIYDRAANRFFLDGDDIWMTSLTLNGPWEVARNPAPYLERLKAEFTQDEEREPSDAAAPNNSTPPAVFVSTVPAELVVTRGEPAFAPITRNLLYVTNSENDIFMDTNSQQYYVLMAGRWYRAKSLDSTWEWLPGQQLPRDFRKISPESVKGHVLASIPETEQAREAVMANQVPQTATVRRSEAKLEVKYDGDPMFRPIEGTSMEYAINTSSEVIHAAERYYACEHGIWFVAKTPKGPWAIADTIPAEIYSIPPSSPLYHLRYVYVYGSTPEVVYVGYTPGYMGAFVSDGVVVFGTGWWYPGWCGPAYYCYGWAWTWGFGFEFSYWGGGWFWWSHDHYWWYHDHRSWHRAYYEHWNSHWRSRDREWVRGNTNAYSHWRGNGISYRDYSRDRSSRTSGRGYERGSGSQGRQLYAGRDGHVYEHRNDGWYQHNNSGQWQRMGQNSQLEQQRQSRSLGESRQREFESRGQSPGVPRTVAPSTRQSAPMRSAPSYRGGGRR
jgi:hypothetical protein